MVILESTWQMQMPLCKKNSSFVGENNAITLPGINKSNRISWCKIFYSKSEPDEWWTFSILSLLTSGDKVYLFPILHDIKSQFKQLQKKQRFFWLGYSHQENKQTYEAMHSFQLAFHCC